MSLRSFYIVISVLLLASLYETSVKAFHPMNVRKLYDFEMDGRYKKDDTSFPLPDEDVLELEKLKQKPLDNLETALDNLELVNQAEKQLEMLSTANKSPTSVLNHGQPEEEEQIVIQHKPPTIAASSHVDHNENHQSQDIVPNTSTAEKSPTPVKPFYGAARLAFGQNPEIITTTSSTTTTTTTSSSTPSNSNPIFINSGPGLATISPPPVPPPSPPFPSSSDTIDTSLGEGNNYKKNHDDDSSSSVSAELEATKNGERRSVDTMPPKIAENLLKHKDGHYSSFDMAQYVFWTGDEAGVAKATEELIQQGLMSRENAIKFLRDIRLGIEYLQNSYTNKIYPEHVKGSGYMFPTLQSTSASTTTTTKTPTTKSSSVGKSLLSSEPENLILTEDLQKALESIPSLLRLQELNNARKKENSIEYDEVTGRARLADFLYAEYSLEEVIYQLAKVMFSQSLTHGSEQSQKALQRLTEFLEEEGEHGRISPALQKKVLDVLLAALADTLAEHPELLAAARAGLGKSFHKLPKTSIIA